jgi:hypothetical protein
MGPDCGSFLKLRGLIASLDLKIVTRGTMMFVPPTEAVHRNMRGQICAVREGMP